MENKNVALARVHENLGAKMIPFAGFNMPVQYSGVTHEHLNVESTWVCLMFHIWESSSYVVMELLIWCKR